MTLGFSQNLKVEYRVITSKLQDNGKQDFNDKEKQALANLINSLKESIADLDITLFTLKDDKFFLSVDEPMSTDISQGHAMGIILLNLHNFIFNYGNGNTLGYTNEREFIVEYDSNMVDWEITSDSKMILGFKCFKAIPTYNHTYSFNNKTLPTQVWFAPSINKKGGPMVYCNLPGLILEVETKFVTIAASNIEKISYDKAVPKIDKKIITEMQAYNRAKSTGAAIESRMKN